MNITKKEFDDLLKEEELLVVDFYADWCVPCQILGPILKDLSDDLKDNQVNINKVNVDEEQALAAEYKIRSIPTILFFKDGEIVEKKIGNVSKSDLEEIINTHIN